MNKTTKKVIAVLSIAAFGVLGSAIPADAAAGHTSKTVWCC